MLKGQIYTLFGQKALVKVGENLIECSLKGSMRKNSVLVGDYVELDDQNRIFKIEKRTSCFSRPSVANVDYVNIVIAPVPKPDFLVVDKMLISIFASGSRPIICVNKCDIEKMEISDRYANVVDKIFYLSSLTGENLSDLKEFLKNKTVAFAGQSAVGKTSLINALLGVNHKVGDLSEKIMRGKNTTTYCYVHENEGIKVVDTPGFTALEVNGISAKNLKDFYPEFKDNTCYYSDCVHIAEPYCDIKEKVKNGEINKDRYENYLAIYNELKDKG